RKRLDRLVRRKRERLAGAEIEARPVARALHGARLLVELALHQRPVVVRAAVLDRVDLAVAVEDADLEVLPLDHAHAAGRQLGHRTDVDLLSHLCHVKLSPTGRVGYRTSDGSARPGSSQAARAAHSA